MKTVLITAGASGIGHATATAFAAQGYQVWVTDVDAGALADCPADWQRSRVDVADETAMAALFAEVDALWGGLDVLCANAGIKGPTAAIEDMPLEGWHQCLGVNLDGAMLAAKYGARMMKPAKSGVMIFTSSTSGLHGTPYRAPYVAAKWATIGLMKTVAMELGPHGIRVNAICPGSVNGPRIDRVIDAEAAFDVRHDDIKSAVRELVAGEGKAGVVAQPRTAPPSPGDASANTPAAGAARLVVNGTAFPLASSITAPSIR